MLSARFVCLLVVSLWWIHIATDVVQLVCNCQSSCLIISDDWMFVLPQPQLLLHMLRKAVIHLRHPVNLLCPALYFTHPRWCGQLSDGLIVFSPAWPVASRAIFTADKHTDPCPAACLVKAVCVHCVRRLKSLRRRNNAVDFNLQTHYFHQPTWVTLINGLATMFWLDYYDVKRVC